ncbi:hypothetical protein QBC43DRAFT_311969 [Cladorrhinum sp. PSN259]|nr:hypothetical protein QBC43DRAFT_311969 [Cladorrhinum sp. PSN259]
MLLQTALAGIAIFLPSLAYAQQDGPIKWEDAPGGSPFAGRLRACAHWALWGGSRDHVQGALGCSVLSCLCRPDLIKKAQDHIVKIVTRDCGTDGTDPTVDIEQTLKVYNDYCSANGYNVPGWTYVKTQTVKLTTVAATPAPSKDIPTTTTVFSASTNASNESIAGAGGGGGATPVITRTVDYTAGSGGQFGGQEGLVTAVVTVTRVSSAGRRSHIPWVPWIPLHLPVKLIIRTASLLSTIPKRLMSAMADTVVVVVTQTPPAPAITSIIIKSAVETQGVPISTEFVTQIVGGSGNSNTGGKSSGKVVADSNTESEEPAQTTPPGGGSSNTKTGDGEKKSLSTLEIVGIIFGIITGFITTVFTVAKCRRPGRLRVRE